jgi:hypothetical protein
VSRLDIERGADSTTWPEIVNPDIIENNKSLYTGVVDH